MKQEKGQVDAGLLKNYSLFSDLSPEQLSLLAENTTVHSERAGRRMIERGTTDNWTWLLLAGRLEMEAADGVKWVVEAGGDKARTPLAQLKPRLYDVRTLSPVSLLRIDDVYLGKLLQGGSIPGCQVQEDADGTSADAGELFYELYQDLNQDKLKLPSLPNLALRIRRTIDAQNSDAEAIAKVIMTDPAITAKLIKTANSPVYRGRAPIVHCAAAIVRLGADTTRQLVVSFVMRELFRTRSSVLQERMEALWRNSALVGAICFVLARRSKHFDPEKAMLIGLLSDIGVVPIISYSEKFPELATKSGELENVVTELRSQIGAMILRKWEFAEDFVEAARSSEEWSRDRVPEADYCDIVQIAKLHSYVGTPRMNTSPAIDQVPAFSKLALGKLSPDDILGLLKEAKEQITQAQQLLVD
jgi:HD-like signal output (HDOD) protein